MDLIRLRKLLSEQISRLKNSFTHQRLHGLCEDLGLPPPPSEQSGLGKRERLEASFTALADSQLPTVAERLLASCPPDASARNNIEDILWSSQPYDVTRRVRRELARSLDLSDLYRDANQFEAVLEKFWVLDNDSFDAFLLDARVSQSLRERIDRHVFRNPGDWDVEDLFEQLGAFNAPSPRFIYFIEALASADVHKDELGQRELVIRANAYLRQSTIELREVGTSEGYPVFKAALLTDKSFSAPKQLIFASPVKPDIRFRSAVDNDIEIVTNADRVLVYDRPIGVEGLTWSSLQDWWKDRATVPSDEEAKMSLYRRLRDGLPENSPPQRRLFHFYFKAFGNEIPRLPALLPEVWLHWDPKTVRERGATALARFRMDFLMLLPHGVRVVIEVDGMHHYAGKAGNADAQTYAATMAADRDLKLAGYEVFRFGAAELGSDNLPQIKEFFERLFDRFNVR